MALVIQSYGSVVEYRRAVLTVLSFYAFSGEEVSTILFTDNPSFFTPYLQGLPVKYSVIDEERLKTMRGRIDFTHRVKICVIEEALRMAQQTVLYADSDTFFTSDAKPFLMAANGSKVFMHEPEYEFRELRQRSLPAGKTFHAFLDLVESNTISGISDERISANMTSWNAGVMILPRSAQEFLPDVYRLTELFYPATGNHASEQYAFSIVLARHFTIAPCAEIVYHYWYRMKKQVVDRVLSERFSRNFTQHSKAEKYLAIRKLSLELPSLLEKHIWIVRDASLQSFHENHFSDGYRYAAQALLRNPVHFPFIKEVLYHTKRLIAGLR